MLPVLTDPGARGSAVVVAVLLAAFALSVLSAVTGFGGGVLLLPVLTAVLGLRVAVPVVTIVQLASNGSRVWLNRGEVHRSLVGWFALGAVPCAFAGGLLLVQAPLVALQRVLGVFLLVLLVWRRVRPRPRPPGERSFVAVGAASGVGSALLGSVGPLTAPLFLAVGLTRGAYVGTEAAGALTLHVTKLAAYGAGDLLTPAVLVHGLALTPAVLAGTWVGKRLVGRLDDRAFVVLVEAGLVVAAVLLVAGV